MRECARKRDFIYTIRVRLFALATSRCVAILKKAKRSVVHRPHESVLSGSSMPLLEHECIILKVRAMHIGIPIQLRHLLPKHCLQRLQSAYEEYDWYSSYDKAKYYGCIKERFILRVRRTNLG